MSEKRFIALGSRFIKDTLTGEEFYAPNEDELLDLLNEQQATIEAKNEYQRTLEAKIRRLKNRIKILEKAEGWQN